MRSFYKFLLSGFGVGWLPLAPGTWGAAVAVLLTVGLAALKLPPSVEVLILSLLTLLFTWIGVKGSALLADEWGKDPKQTVIDEMVGTWISLLGAPLTALNVLLAFVLFRFFDILKPLGIRQAERLAGGWGVMADDILAGVYANIVLQIILIALHH